jgi:hypothetical protein
MYSLEPTEDNQVNLLEEPLTKTQSDLLDHIITKVPVSRALGNRVLLEVLDFIGVMLLLKYRVDFPRIGRFGTAKANNGRTQVIFVPSQHLEKLLGTDITAINKEIYD